MALDVEMINRDTQQAMLTDGRVVPWETMIDIDGDETDDPELAIAVVVKADEGVWLTFALSDFNTHAEDGPWPH